jgi:hypothetical protein
MSEEGVQMILERLDKLEKLMRGQAPGAPDLRAIPDHPMTPAEFGRVVGKSALTVRRWIGLGKLRAKTDCRPMLITPANARRFLNPKEERE